MNSTNFQNKVYGVVSKIHRGKTMTHKEVAKAIGSPRAYRVVGNALNKNPYVYSERAGASRKTKLVPCHRVICSNGSIGGFATGSKDKLRLLEREGLKL